MATPTTHQPLIASLWPTGAASPLTRNVLLAVLGTLILWASAKVQVPFWPVPMTMQSMVVLLIGVAYGWRLGGATVLLYLAEGATGLPVFAGTPEKGIGLAYMAGPTGGYLVGFVLAAWLTGWMAERGLCRQLPAMIATLLAGTIVLFATGVAWLSVVIGVEKAIQFGLTPFLFGAAVKIALAAALLGVAWKWAGRRGNPTPL